jgi:hypothetical protein
MKDGKKMKEKEEKKRLRLKLKRKKQRRRREKKQRGNTALKDKLLHFSETLAAVEKFCLSCHAWYMLSCLLYDDSNALCHTRTTLKTQLIGF